MGSCNLLGGSGNKKTYYHHSGYVGGIKAVTAAGLFARDPGELVRRAVKGMLPKNKLQAKRLKKLKTYTDDKHQHTAQMPIPLADFTSGVQEPDEHKNKEQESKGQEDKIEVREISEAIPAMPQGSES